MHLCWVGLKLSELTRHTRHTLYMAAAASTVYHVYVYTHVSTYMFVRTHIYMQTSTSTYIHMHTVLEGERASERAVERASERERERERRQEKEEEVIVRVCLSIMTRSWGSKRTFARCPPATLSSGCRLNMLTSRQASSALGRRFLAAPRALALRGRRGATLPVSYYTLVGFLYLCEL